MIAYIARGAFVSLLLCASSSHAWAQTGVERLALDPLLTNGVNYAGSSVALSGDRVISSARGRLDPNSGYPIGESPGFVYLMDAVSGQELTRLLPSNPMPRDFFGYRVAAHGGRGLVSSLLGDGVVTDSGAAYVFDLQSGQQVWKLEASDGEPLAGFGSSLDLDDNHAIVGAQGPFFPHQTRGAAYIFDLSTGQQLHKLTVQGLGEFAAFGNSVAIEGDLALVGYDSSGSTTPSGQVFVFDTNSGQLIRTLSPSGPAINGEAFGRSLDLVGTTAFVGAPLSGIPQANGTGSVYLFDVTTGQQLQRFDAGPQGAANSFGSVVRAGDDRVAVGAPFQNTSGFRSGAAYVFEASTGQLLSRLIPSDSMPYDFFGFSLDYENGRIVVGAPFSQSDQAVPPAGGAYLFDDSVPNSGQGFCFGDGSGAPCPCGTTGELEQGCSNSTLVGARLYGAGNAQIGSDEFLLSASQLPQNSSAVFFQGDTQQILPLGEGLLCTTVTKRYSVQVASSLGALSLDGLSASATPGATINYQLWYRDSQSSCGLGGFNFSNGWTVTW